MSHLPEFSSTPNDFTTAILKSFENFYHSDCSKLFKLKKPGFDTKALANGIPSNFVCFSTAIKNIISTVDSVTRGSFLSKAIEEITERVNVEVFCDKLEAVENEPRKTVASELSRRAADLNCLTNRSLLYSPVAKKESLQIKSSKRVLENQRKIKGMLEIKKSARVSPVNNVAVANEDSK